jgi:FKBP-type peptidyl-prolyl cis-trans isomerase (trigger factor)
MRSCAADGDQVVIDFAGYVEQTRPFNGTPEQAEDR